MILRQAKYDVSIVLCVLRDFKIFKLVFSCFNSTIYFFIINKKNMVFQVKKSLATLVLNLMVTEIFYDNLFRFRIRLNVEFDIIPIRNEKDIWSN